MAVASRVASTCGVSSSCVWNGREFDSSVAVARRRLPVSQAEARIGRSSELTKDDKAAAIDSSPQATMERLERITSPSRSSDTIAEQLIRAHGSDENLTISVPLATSASAKRPTVAQQRNIRRQDYLNKVAQRDDRGTFAAVGLFVLVPPMVILGAAIATGYVDILP